MFLEMCESFPHEAVAKLQEWKLVEEFSIQGMGEGHPVLYMLKCQKEGLIQYGLLLNRRHTSTAIDVEIAGKYRVTAACTCCPPFEKAVDAIEEAMQKHGITRLFTRKMGWDREGIGEPNHRELYEILNGLTEKAWRLN